MKRILALVALTGVSACSDGFSIPDFRSARTDPTPVVVPAPPPAPVILTAKERLVVAIENNGCALTTENVATILDEATIGQQELLQIAPELAAEGRAEVAGDGAIRVITDRCVA